MKISELLQIQSIIDKRAVPQDMYDEHLVYYSKSRDKWISIVDMDICHLIRAFKKIYDPNEYQEDNNTDLENLSKYLEETENLLENKRKEYLNTLTEIEKALSQKVKKIQENSNKEIQ